MLIGIYGFGSIGRLVAKYAVMRGHDIVGVVDIDENIVGRDIGEVLGLDASYGIRVSKDPIELADAEVVFHATGSFLDKVYTQIEQLIKLGVDVVSTCETLAYPYYRYPVLARKLDKLAVSRSVSVIGTGVNPGFVFDTLLIVLSSTLPVVEHVKAVRSLDAGKRRSSFRRKIGVGGKPEEVREKLSRGELTGHVGYAESVLLVADTMGIQPTRIEEYQDVVVADKLVESGKERVQPGYVSGIKGCGIAYAGNRELIRVELYAVVGADEYEEVVVDGGGDVVKWRSTGVHGDTATAAVLLNVAEKIGEYGPGLLTMADLLPFKPYAKVL